MPVRPSPFAAPGATWGDPVVTWGDPLWRYDGRLYGPLSWGGPGSEERQYGYAYRYRDPTPGFEVPGGLRPAS